MSRQESQLLKGVAILLMIFSHLFYAAGNVDILLNFIYIKSEPLVQYLSRAANPVAFFLILGGYGLYKVYLKGDRHRWSRPLKLYIHYWTTLVVFVGIGHFMYPELYPGSIGKIIANISAFHTTYNCEMWFLLPYILLALLSPILFRYTAKIKWWVIILITFSIYLCTSYCISRYGTEFLYKERILYNPLLVFHFLFSFSLGAVAARDHFFEWLKRKTNQLSHRSLTAVLTILALVAIRCEFKYFFGYEFLIICAICLISMPRIINRMLVALGNRSMDMWMIHTWFCTYLFHGFIYSFKYPLLIFTVLTLISYYSSVVNSWLAFPIERLFLSKTEIKKKPIL